MAAERFDITVVGGGMAGVAAAIAAGERGARTLLIERSDVLGGNATNAMVHSFCGLYEPATDAGPVHAHPGFPQRFAEGLRRAGGAGEPERSGKVFVLPTFPHVLEEYVLGVCAAVASLECRRGTEVVAVTLADDASEESLVTVKDSAGRFAEIATGIVIDSSGDATAAVLGGADWEESAAADLQSPSYILRVSGVDTSGWRGYSRLRLTYAVAHGVKEGRLPAGCESVLIRPAAIAGEAYLTLNIAKLTDQPYRPLDARYVEQLESTAQQRATALVNFLRASRAEFAHCVVAAWPRRIGIRETRRVRGRYMLTADDILTARRDTDEVARSTWPIELWPDHLRPVFEYAEGPSSIPLGALLSRSHPRLGVAGRCMSATHEALGAVRVLGTAMATGEAVGVAAAIALHERRALWDVPPAAVRRAIQDRDHIV